MYAATVYLAGEMLVTLAHCAIVLFFAIWFKLGRRIDWYRWEKLMVRISTVPAFGEFSITVRYIPIRPAEWAGCSRTAISALCNKPHHFRLHPPIAYCGQQ